MAKKQYKNLTLAKRMEMFIIAEMGWKPIESKNKYKMFERADIVTIGNDTLSITKYLFIGKNGAVRMARGTKAAAESHSLTNGYQAALKSYEDSCGPEYLQKQLEVRNNGQRTSL